jgi:Protein of unknown function (DUF1360)
MVAGMNVPDWWEALLLALAAYRVWHLVADDTIFDVPRARLLRLGNWRVEGDPVPAGYRRFLGDFIDCAWCLGFWIALAWWAAWQAWPHATLVAATPFALSAAVGFARSRLDSDE